MTTRSLLLRTVAALTLTAGLSLLCVLFVDRPAASFLHEYSAVGSDLWQLGPQSSDRLKYFSALAIFFVVVWPVWKKGGRVQAVLLAMAANLIVVTAD